jgi:hypothetical protein
LAKIKRTYFEEEIEGFIAVSLDLGYSEAYVEEIAEVMRRNPGQLFRCMPTWVPYYLICNN